MRNWNRAGALLASVLMVLGLAACGGSRGEEASSRPVQESQPSQAAQSSQPVPSSAGEAETGEGSGSGEASSGGAGENAAQETGLIANQILESREGPIHYSYYLPEGYGDGRTYPLMVVMPGYDRMWFGEESEGSNLDWNGFQVWTQLEEEMIVVSAQLTDWGETSARQANLLTHYFLENFDVDPARVYGAGYSAGGETMSQAVSLEPDLYAAYLHGSSQWDGGYEPLAQSGVAVYIFMAENDEYYGSQRARDAYESLLAAYEAAGRTQEEARRLLRLDIREDSYFNSLGITNYHGGGSVLFNEESIQNWVLEQRRQ